MHVALIGAELEENLAVRYLWGALERAGHRVTFIVFNEPGELEFCARALVASGAELAGLSMVFTARADEFAALASRARELGYRGHLVAGGHFAAFHAEELLADVAALDSVACGEGEELIVALAAQLDDLAEVAGLVWRDGERSVRNVGATKPPDLDTLAQPRRKLPFDDFLGLPIVNMLSSRGCSHACSFCSIAAWHKLCGGERFRLRAPESVAAEMAELYEQGVRLFNFHDDNFFLRDREAMLRRVDRLERELGRRKVGEIAFAVKSRPDTVDEEVFARLVEMGLFRVFMGIEAGTADSLRRLGRGQTVQDNERALDVVGRLDVHACFNLLLLNPDSTLEDLAGNVAFLRRRARNPMNFCRTEVYAGTPLERQLRAQGRLTGSYWQHSYRIADPRAQRAYELIVPSFATRNYGEHCLHHRAMHVDYEHQLLRRFFGGDEDLHGRVQEYVVAVNRNTCDHLDAIVAAVADGEVERQPLDVLVAAFSERVEADNLRLGRLGDALLAEIRLRAHRQEPAARTWVRTATAAGLAVSLTVSAAACDRPQTHATETVAVPSGTKSSGAGATSSPLPSSLPSAQASSQAQPSAQPSASLPPGDSELLKPRFRRQELPFIADVLSPARAIEITFEVDEEGRVSEVEARADDLPSHLKGAIEERVRSWKVTEPEAAGRRYRLSFSLVEVAAAKPVKRKPPPRPEMIPPDRPPRPPPAEMIAPAPKPKAGH